VQKKANISAKIFLKIKELTLVKSDPSFITQRPVFAPRGELGPLGEMFTTSFTLRGEHFLLGI
jgi:hypothetical protein